MAAGERILVIKLSALGDFIQALGPFAAIRHHNPDASITLLTTAPFAGFAKAAPWFDTVLVDDRPRIFDFGGWLRLRGKLRSGGFARIYDLQTSGRSGFYFAVVEEGGLGAGDAIELKHRDTKAVTVADVNRLYLDKGDPELLDRVLDVPTLAGSMRRHFEKRRPGKSRR